MVTIDRSGINQANRDLPLRWELGTLVEQVSLAKPLCEFKVDDDCIHTKYTYKDVVENGVTTSKRFDEKTIQKVNVYQDGEALGYLFVQERYHNRTEEMVYGVGSFRIQKERGNLDATTSKNIKVILRTAKKVLINRQDEELIKLINEQIVSNLQYVVSNSQNAMRYNMDTQTESGLYALAAYKARKMGHTAVSLPSMPTTVRKPAEHDKNCENFMQATELWEAQQKGNGYGVSLYSNGSMAVLNFADKTVKKYKSLDLLPVDMQSKLAMFKVINVREPYAHLGCKFEGDMYFIVGGELALES